MPHPRPSRASLLRIPLLACVLGASLLIGCASSQRADGPYQAQSEAARDPQRAQALTREAVRHMQEEPEKAERLLREALTADLYHGPAHNNLGVLHLERGELYEAASEFEWGRKLLPGHPDPRVNLALTLELAGKSVQAQEAFETALEVAPEHVPAMQGLARLRVKGGVRDARTKELLEDVALRGENSRWREWARSQLARPWP